MRIESAYYHLDDDDSADVDALAPTMTDDIVIIAGPVWLCMSGEQASALLGSLQDALAELRVRTDGRKSLRSDARDRKAWESGA